LDYKSILLSPTSTYTSDVDVATIAAELVHRVLGIHHFVTAAYEYRGDLPVVDNVAVSGNVPHHRNNPKRHNSNTKHQTNIDWDRFLDIFQSTVALAQHLFPEYNCCLLHIVCLCSAPEDVVQALLDISLLPLRKKCGMDMEATPLHLACFAGCSARRSRSYYKLTRNTLFMMDAEDRIPLHVAFEKGADGTASSVGIVKSS
jgi:hypothetical protein